MVECHVFVTPYAVIFCSVLNYTRILNCFVVKVRFVATPYVIIFRRLVIVPFLRTWFVIEFEPIFYATSFQIIVAYCSILFRFVFVYFHSGKCVPGVLGVLVIGLIFARVVISYIFFGWGFFWCSSIGSRQSPLRLLGVRDGFG